MECLDDSARINLIKTLKELYNAKNSRINSHIHFLYKKVNSGLVRDIWQLIPENNIINDGYLAKPESNNKILII